MLQLVLILFISCSVRYSIAQQHSALYSGCSIDEKPFVLSTAVDMLCKKRAAGLERSTQAAVTGALASLLCPETSSADTITSPEVSCGINSAPFVM